MSAFSSKKIDSGIYSAELHAELVMFIKMSLYFAIDMTNLYYSPRMLAFDKVSFSEFNSFLIILFLFVIHYSS